MTIILVKLAIQIVLWAIVIGAGLWYMASSIDGGFDVPYPSMDRFLQTIGACQSNQPCDLASIKGCLLCPYVERLFLLIGDATETLWKVVIGHTWLLMAIGLVIVMFWQAYKILTDARKETQNAEAADQAKKLAMDKWWEAIKQPFIRVLVVGALMGLIGAGGTGILKTMTNVVVYPIMTVGTALSTSALGISGAECGAEIRDNRIEHFWDFLPWVRRDVITAADIRQNPMAPVSGRFMCIMGSLNAAILYGAAGGFAMMNFAWQGIGGGFFGWIAGLLIVLAFLYIGANVIFKVLNVVFNIVFMIMFLPLLLAAWAFETSWEIAKGVSTSVIDMLGKTTVKVLAISLEIMIFSAMISYARQETLSSNPEVEQAIFAKCERQATRGAKVDKDIYKDCFAAERRAHPDAFQYLDRSWSFLIMLLFLIIIYKALVEKKLQERIQMSGEGSDNYMRFGDGVKGFFTTAWKLPFQLLGRIVK